MNATNGKSLCVGRFAFMAPETMMVNGRGQSIYSTAVEAVPLPADGLDAYWTTRLKRMGPEPRVFELETGVKAAWSARNPQFPNILTIETAKPVEGAVLVAEREADAGKESIAETLVKVILRSYVPASGFGFCVGSGALTVDPSINETARLTLGGRDLPEMELQMETHTVGEPDLTTGSNVEEERAFVGGAGGTLRVLRDQTRAAAGLEGKEIWISAEFPGEKPGLRFSWHYPGVAASGVLPSIHVVASAPLERRSRLELLWESVMVSLQRIPLNPPSDK
ncbi:MAG TPA: T6SS immunity protein Tli4 family protein [Bryobacteraceae bacterium]|nr:T6SS immunity protein Tli4 family protein [Bryobacteraceae bacterium]